MNRYLGIVLLVASATGCTHNTRQSETARSNQEERGDSSLYGRNENTLPTDQEATPMVPPTHRSRDEIASAGSLPDNTRPRNATDQAVPTDSSAAPNTSAGATARAMPGDQMEGETAPAAGLTATDQSDDESDVKLTQDIRRALVASPDLSFSSKNVKIITRDGRVTLRGSVPNRRELSLIEDAAKQAAGVGRVDNQLEISTK